MSLLNEMLRDLDKRAVKNTGMLEAVKVNDTPKYNDRKFNYFLLAYVCFVALVSGALFYDVDVYNTKSPAENRAKFSSFGSVNVFSENGLILEALSTRGRLSHLSPTPLKPQFYEKTDRVATGKPEVVELIQQAKLAVKDLRLTRPNKNNTLYYVGQVLQLDPTNIEVQSIMQSARQRYLDVFRQHLENNQKLKAKVLIDRAHLLSVDRNTISWMSDRLVEATAIDDKLSQALGEPSEQGEMQVVFSEETSEQKVIELAVLEINKDKSDAAIEMLQNYIRIHPTAYSVILRLFEMYISTKDFLEAESLATEAASVSSVLSQYFSARLQAEKGRLSQALYLLSQLDYRDIPLNSILAYRAALAQKLENSGAASRDYAYLVRSNPLNSGYWLGLALALESEKQFHEALKAYVSVNKINDQPEEVEQFVTRKIGRLSAFQIAGTDKW